MVPMEIGGMTSIDVSGDLDATCLITGTPHLFRPMSDMGATSLGEDDSSLADNASAAPSVDRLKGAYHRAVAAVEGKNSACSKLAEWEQHLDSPGRHTASSSNRREVPVPYTQPQYMHSIPHAQSIPHTQWGFVQDQLGAYARELARLRQDLEKMDSRQTEATRSLSVTQAEVAKESMSLLYQLTTEQKRFKEAVERERSTRQESVEQLDSQLQEALSTVRADLKAESLARKEACMNINGDLTMVRQTVDREVRDRVNAMDQVTGEVARICHAHEQEVQDRTAAATRLHQALEQEVQARTDVAGEVTALRRALDKLERELEQEVNDRGAADSDTVASMKRVFEQEAQFRQAISGKAEQHALAIQQLVSNTESLRQALDSESQDRSAKEQETSRSMRQIWEQDNEFREAIVSLRSSINQDASSIGQLEIRMSQTNETLTTLTAICDRLSASVTSQIQAEGEQRVQAFGAMAADLARVEQQIAEGDKQASSDKAAAEKRHLSLQLSLESMDMKLHEEFSREFASVKVRQHTDIEKLRELFSEHATSFMEHRAVAREDRQIYAAQRAEFEHDLRGELSKVAAQVAEWNDIERRLREDFKQMSMSKEAGIELEERLQAIGPKLEAVDAQMQERLGEMTLAVRSHVDDVGKMRDLITGRALPMDNMSTELPSEIHSDSVRHVSRAPSPVSQQSRRNNTSIATLPGSRMLSPPSSLVAPVSARVVMDVLPESPRQGRMCTRNVSEMMELMEREVGRPRLPRGGSVGPEAVRQASAPQLLSSPSLMAPAAATRRPSWEPVPVEQRQIHAVSSATVMTASSAMAAPAMVIPSGGPSVAQLQHVQGAAIQRAASAGRLHGSPLRRVPPQGLPGHPSIAGLSLPAAPV